MLHVSENLLGVLCRGFPFTRLMLRYSPERCEGGRAGATYIQTGLFQYLSTLRARDPLFTRAIKKLPRVGELFGGLLSTRSILNETFHLRGRGGQVQAGHFQCLIRVGHRIRF